MVQNVILFFSEKINRFNMFLYLESRENSGPIGYEDVHFKRSHWTLSNWKVILSAKSYSFKAGEWQLLMW